MDRALVYGTRDIGSNPFEGTYNNMQIRIM